MQSAALFQYIELRALALTIEMKANHSLADVQISNENLGQPVKPVGAMAEGLQLLLLTGNLHGRTIASGLQPPEDARNAGVNSSDESVVCDKNLITARTVTDVEAFNREFSRVLGEIREHFSEIRRTA